MGAEERRLSIEVLHHLREISPRKLHLRLGFASLFTYLTQELKYAEATAYRRIESMRLLDEMPEFEMKVASGELNLTTISQVATFLKSEERERGRAYSTDEKKDLLHAVEGKSKRECEALLAAHAPERSRPGAVRAISPPQTEIRFVADRELVEKLGLLKGRLAHRLEGQDYCALFHALADIAIRKVNPQARGSKREAESQSKHKERLSVTADAAKDDSSEGCGDSGNHQNSAPLLSPVKAMPAVPAKGASAAVAKVPPAKEIPATYDKRTPSAEVVRVVRARDEDRCSYVEPVSGRRCDSRHFLEIHHVVPWSHGGRTDVPNLRLLCSPHHALETEKEFGRRGGER